MKSTNRVTIKDVARIAGVSRQTVSRAINDKSEIKPETRARILELVERLNYRPNRLAQAMITQRTGMIGFVVPDITNPFFPEVARGVQDAAFAKEYNVLLCNSDDNAEVEKHLMETLIAQGVDGIILFSHRMADWELIALAERFRPILLINRTVSHPNISVLNADNVDGAMQVVEHFVRAGHHEIGMLNNIRLLSTQSQRALGFTRAMLQHGLNPSHVVSAEPTMAGGYLGAQQLLGEFPQTSAIFAYNDLMGIGAIRAIQNSGRRVGDDVAVVGYDDIGLSAMTRPSLSTVKVDKKLLGSTAFNHLNALLLHPMQSPPAVDLTLKLVQRESSRCSEGTATVVR